MMKKKLTNLCGDLTALLLGIALTFAFAPYDIFPLAIILPAGLLLLWLNVSRKRALLRGFLFGAGLFGAGVYWVFISIHRFGDVPSLFAGLITAGMIAILASYPALVGYCLQRFFPNNQTTKMVCAFPALWVLSEWVRSWFLTGFAWLFLGYSQTNSPLSGFAPILSVYGVSLAVVMTSGLLVNGLLYLKQGAYRATYFNMMGIVIIWIAASLLNLIPWTKPNGDPIPVSLVQGSIPQAIKWSPEYLKLSFDRYTELTEPLWQKSKLIIWPEGAIPTTVQNAAEFIEVMNNKAKSNQTHLILGIPIQSTTSENYYNAIIALGEQHGVYLKRHLVPFGEYVPLEKLFLKILNFMHLPTFAAIPGKHTQTSLTLGNLKILTSICYEISFPELIHSNDKNISMLLTVTNDAWFGRSSAQAQHLQMTAMRAMELRRPAMIVSNDGITAIIGPYGDIQAKAPPYQLFVLNGTVQPTQGLTPWMRNGMDPILIIVIVLLFIGIRANRLNASSLIVAHTNTNK